MGIINKLITKNSVYSLAYNLNNRLRDSYIKYKEAIDSNCSSAVINYFSRRLDDTADIRNSIYEEFRTKYFSSKYKNEVYINKLKNECFAEIKKAFPNIPYNSFDEVINLDLGECLYMPLEKHLYEAMQNTKPNFKYQPYQIKFLNLINSYANLKANSVQSDILLGIFEQTSEYGRDKVRDSSYEQRQAVPECYNVTDNTLAISIKKIKNYSTYFNMLLKNYSKTEAKLKKDIQKLNNRANTATNSVKNICELRLESLNSRLHNIEKMEIILNDITSMFSNIIDRTVGINDKSLPLDLKIYEAINNFVDTSILKLQTGEFFKISNVNNVIDFPHENVIVHSLEIDEILDSSKYLFEAIMPMAEIAKMTDKYVYYGIEDTQYSIALIKYIYDKNVDKIEDEVELKAKQEKTSFENMWNKTDEETLQSFGYDKDMLKHIVYLTPNGNFTFDGVNLFNAKTNELVEFNDFFELYSIFGVDANLEDNEENLNDTITTDQDNASEDGGME